MLQHVEIGKGFVSNDEGLFKQLPPEIILEIMSFLQMDCSLFDPEVNENLVKQMFGKFGPDQSSTIHFLFGNLNRCWNMAFKSKLGPRVFKISKNHKRNEFFKLDLCIPPLEMDPHSIEKEIQEFLDQLFKHVDLSAVKSIVLDTQIYGLYVCKTVLEHFTHVEELTIVHDQFSRNSQYAYYELTEIVSNLKLYGGNLRNLTKLKLDCVDEDLSDCLVEISKYTPLVETLSNCSLTSIFTAPEIFENWKNLKNVTSTIMCIRGTIPKHPSEEEVNESFEAISKLQHLEKLKLCAENAHEFGVPYCESLKTISVSLFYAYFSTKLMKCISQNTQLKEIHLENGLNEGMMEVFQCLDFENLKQLEIFGAYSLNNEYAQHVSKSESIRKLDIEFAEIDREGLDYLLKLPRLESIDHSEGFNGKRLDYDKEEEPCEIDGNVKSYKIGEGVLLKCHLRNY